LPYDLEGLRPEVAELVSCLPEGSDLVFYSREMVGIAMPHLQIPEVTGLRIRKAMKNFSGWSIVGLTGDVYCKDGWMDPLRTWVDKNLKVQDPGEGRQPENVNRPQRRKIRLKSPD
jgi:hypothetical protein